MFVGKIVNNYTAAILDAAGDKLHEICSQLEQLNSIVSSLKVNYNQAIFSEGAGQKILIEALKKLDFEDLVINLFRIINNVSRFDMKEYKAFKKLNETKIYWHPNRVKNES